MVNRIGDGERFNMLTQTLEKISFPAEIDDLERKIVFVNTAWCVMFNMSRDEVLGARWDSLRFPGPELHDELLASWRRCLDEGAFEGVCSITLAELEGETAPVPYSRSLYRERTGEASAVVTIFRPTL